MKINLEYLQFQKTDIQVKDSKKATLFSFGFSVYNGIIEYFIFNTSQIFIALARACNITTNGIFNIIWSLNLKSFNYGRIN